MGSDQPAKDVPLQDIETMSQLSRMASGLKKKLKNGDLKARDLCALCRVAAKTKFFDGELFEELHPVLKKELKRRRFSDAEAMEVILSLASLNAYDAGVFDAACALLQPSLVSLSSADLKSIRAALETVKHK